MADAVTKLDGTRASEDVTPVPLFSFLFEFPYSELSEGGEVGEGVGPWRGCTSAASSPVRQVAQGMVLAVLIRLLVVRVP